MNKVNYVQCPNCFEPVNSKGGKQYCNKKCYNERNNKFRRQENMDARFTPDVIGEWSGAHRETILTSDNRQGDYL